MPTEYSDESIDEVGRLSGRTTPDVTIQIGAREGHQFIMIKEQHRAGFVSTTEHIIEIPAALLPALKRAVAAVEQNLGDLDERDQLLSGQPTNFAHESEAEFARLLDVYHIAWRYEPRTFAIEWDDDGKVSGSFTPDFYLPDQDLYIELATAQQPLVTKKNPKIRRLGELYREVNIKVLYAPDYEKLVARLQLLDQTEKGKRFEVRARLMGTRTGMNYDSISDLLEQIEGPDHR